MIALPRRSLLATLIAAPAALQAQGRDATPAGFAGRIFVNEAGGIRTHTYMAAPQGALVTSHVIETTDGLVLVDGQFTADAGGELRRLIDGLGRPVARTLLSHQHPDHWFGMRHAGIGTIQCGPATAAFLRAQGAALIAQRQANTSVPAIERELTAGEERIGGVTFRFRLVRDTEAPEMLVIELPQAGTMIVQDLMYNRVHAVVSRQLAAWTAVLRDLRADGSRTPTILAGHGEPAAVGDLDEAIRYLEAVATLLPPTAAPPPEPIIAAMTRLFPQHRLPPLLALGVSRLPPA